MRRSPTPALPLLLLALSTSACILPALVGGNTIAADELSAGTSQFALENEMSRSLVSEGKTDGTGAFADAYWISSDLAFRRGLSDRIGIEGAVRFAWALPLPLPAPIGLMGGAIYRLDSPTSWLHLAARAQVTAGGISISSSAGGVQRNESASFAGATLSFLASARLGERTGVAFTVAPFVRAYGVNHKLNTTSLDQTFIAPSLGISANLQLRLWYLEITPMGTLELAFAPTDGTPFVLPMGGVTAGLRF